MTEPAPKTAATNAIEFRNVSIGFDETPVLSDISFHLGHGEMLLLTGLSGSGKSVLLRLAIGLLRPDSGQIFIEGRGIETLDESELLAIRGGLMGMVFQEESLFTGITVYENAAYRLAELGWPEDKIDKAVGEVLQFVGLAGEEKKFPEELSGGMKRRLEIARALVGWPSILLFDEPATMLDPIVAVQVLDVIIRSRDIKKSSSIYVSKRLHEINYLSNYRAFDEDKGRIVIRQAPEGAMPKTRIIVLESNRIAFTGSFAEFLQSELFTIKELLEFDQHDHTSDPYFPDPWNKDREPREIL